MNKNRYNDIKKAVEDNDYWYLQKVCKDELIQSLKLMSDEFEEYKKVEE